MITVTAYTVNEHDTDYQIETMQPYQVWTARNDELAKKFFLLAVEKVTQWVK